MTAADTSAAGSQPSPLPVIHQAAPAPGCYYPNRAGHAIAVFVRHNTVGTNSLPWFQNPASGVSIHHLVNRDGSRTDMVRRAAIAFHTGESAYLHWHGSVDLPVAVGWPGGCRLALLNAVSLGMEIESTAGNGPGDGYTDAQLWTAAYTEASSLISYAGIQVVDHKSIALPPGRRLDPAYFPLLDYLARVRAWVTFLRATPPAESGKYFL